MTTSFFKPLYALTAFSLIAVTGCTSIKGEGPVLARSRSIAVFTQLTVDVAADVTLVISDSVKCVVTAQDNIQKIIDVTNDGDELVIKSSKSYHSEKPVEIVIAVPSVTRIKLKGSGNVNVLNTVHGEKLHLTIQGSGNIKVDTEVSDLRTVIEGSGDMTIKGKTSNHKAEIDGSGNLHAADLNSETSDISINGSGNADVNVGKELEAEVNGSGNIRYCGAPSVHSNINGSGGISRCNQ